MSNRPGRETIDTFEHVASYLLHSGWYRDGDDLGIWHPPQYGGPPCSMWEAFGIQFVRDGGDEQMEVTA